MIVPFKSQRHPGPPPVRPTPKRVVRLTVWMNRIQRTKLTFEAVHANV
jgi:hypothetical protein